MTIDMILFVVFVVLFLAAYCWFYKPKNFYGGYPAKLWNEPDETQKKKSKTRMGVSA